MLHFCVAEGPYTKADPDFEINPKVPLCKGIEDVSSSQVNTNAKTYNI